MNLEIAKQELEGDRITVGLATCGISAGGIPVYEALKQANLGINTYKVGCIGMCYNEPVVTLVRNGVKEIYAKVTKDNVQKLIGCIKSWKRCEELYLTDNISKLDFYRKQKRLVMDNCGIIDPLKLEHYLYMGGYSGLKKAIAKSGDDVINDVKASGIRGRGGAGFPTWKKWSLFSGHKGKKYLICNGDEGDPGAFMNRTVMESDPFRLIEGMTIGAYATGADEGVIYTRAEYPLAIETLEKALKTAYDNGFLGKDILGKKGFSFRIWIMKGAGAFVCGEETALINSIEGKRGMPRPRPPFPAQKGLYGRPTNVNNVGTWAHVATAMKIGPEEYAKVGSEKTKGTKVICLAGKVKRAGIIEVPIGMPIRDIVFDIGGGTPEGTEFKAVLSGGPAGGCIPKEKLDTPLDFETLQSIGAIMGSGGMVIINNKACMVDVAKYFMRFTQEESCGKCTPCREGTKRLLEMLTNVTRGVGEEKDLNLIETLAVFVRDNSLCGLGQNAPNPLLSTMMYFRHEYVAHLRDKKCPAGGCRSLMEYFITEKCIGCGLCMRNCPTSAIGGEPKKRHEIHQEKCIKCGKCYDSCRFDAIIKR